VIIIILVLINNLDIEQRNISASALKLGEAYKMDLNSIKQKSTSFD